MICQAALTSLKDADSEDSSLKPKAILLCKASDLLQVPSAKLPFGLDAVARRSLTVELFKDTIPSLWQIAPSVIVWFAACREPQGISKKTPNAA